MEPKSPCNPLCSICSALPFWPSNCSTTIERFGEVASPRARSEASQNISPCPGIKTPACQGENVTRMAKMKRKVLVLTALLAAMCVPQLHAWQAEPTAMSTAYCCDDTASQGAATSEQPSQSAHALDSSGVILMSAIRGTHLLAGGTISGGLDSNPNNSDTGSVSRMYSFSPYLGLAGNAGRTKYVLQYHPMINQSSGYSMATLHQASVNVVREVTERWNWTFGMFGSQGQDSLRLLAPGTPQNAASYLPNAGSQTSLTASFDLRYLLSPKNIISWRLDNSYNSLQAYHQSNSVVSATAHFDRSISQRFAVLSYGRVSEYYGDVACWAFGGGVGIVWHPGDNSEISLNGGPQLNSPGCKRQQGFSYDASLSEGLPRRAKIYLLASRQPGTGSLGGGLWQDNVSAGYQREIFGTNIISAGVGYTRSSTLVNAATYQGTYFDASYTRPLRGNLSFTSTFRSLTSYSGSTTLGRSTFIGQLTFSPNLTSIFGR
jgi:hypothetical protein